MRRFVYHFTCALLWAACSILLVGCPDKSACCQNGQCTEVETAEDCTGTFLDGKLCADVDCGRKACCDEDAACTLWFDGDQCPGIHDDDLGDGSACEPNPCPDRPEGACCTFQGCFIAHRNVCEDASGTYNGDGSSCSPNPCDGACCTNGTCLDSYLGICDGEGDTFIPDAMCTGVDCAKGACCLTTGVCTPQQATACQGNLTYLGDGTSCNPNPCPQPNKVACCFTETGECTLRGGCLDGETSLGEGSVCEPNSCPQPPDPMIGACCSPAGTCAELFPNACGNLLNWVFKGAGSSCATPNICD
ncbi:MAG: hypothetical protein KC466_09300 [Myxococcales bacterium]|nr:hypothetical protein [Myxococcales bacterium]